MKCPNCNKEMKEKTEYYYGLGEWDCDYPGYWTTTYKCKGCKITCEENDSYYNYSSEPNSREWKIPKKYERSTEKQIKCVKIINKVLGTNFESLLKAPTTKFIKENMDKSVKKSKENKLSNWSDYDDYGYMEEYF